MEKKKFTPNPPSFSPKGPVSFTREEAMRLSEEGLRLRREIEQRAANMKRLTEEDLQSRSR